MTRRRRRQGSGEILQEGVGWALRWREAGKRRYRGGFATRADAQQVLDKVRGELAMGRAGMPSAMKGAQTLGALAPAWLDRRKGTHRVAREDRRRWDKHLVQHFGHMKPGEVTHATIRRFIEERRQAGLAPGTVGLCVYLLSSLMADLVERELVPSNLCRSLPRSTRRLFKSDHNPEDTPYVERLEDVRRIFLALPAPVNVAYALGAMAGLRIGEIVALRWESVDLATKRITVRVASSRADRGAERAPKDGDVRVAPIQDGLLPVLTAWKLKTGGHGLVVPPLQVQAAHLSRNSLWEGLRAALKATGFPATAWTPGTAQTVTWYCATRHTFASHWVLAGGSLATLARILGHSSVTITERHYVHLRPDSYAERDFGTVSLDLRPGDAPVGQILARPEEEPTGNACAAATAAPSPRT